MNNGEQRAAKRAATLRELIERYNHRYYALDDPAVSEAWQTGSSWIFDQDVAALNAQEARLQRLPADHIELSIPGDAAALAARKVVKQLAALERREAVIS